jgi:ParB family transcriptional regulator, chromosome partitioning protein
MSRLDRFQTARTDTVDSTQISELQARIEQLQKEQPTNRIDPHLIKRSPYQPRKYFNVMSQADLTANIKEFGVLQNLVVRITGGQYELVAGERRLISAVEAGVATVPVLVMDLSDRDARRLALAENLLREDLNALEETFAVLNLLCVELGVDSTEEVKSMLYSLSNTGKGHKSTDNVIGNSEHQSIIDRVLAANLRAMNMESFIRNRLPLLDLPDDVSEAIMTGLEYTKATAIARVEDPSQRADLLRCATEDGMPLTEVRKQIKALDPSIKADPTPKDRVSTTLSKVRKLKVWEDGEKWAKVEHLLAQLDELLV